MKTLQFNVTTYDEEGYVVDNDDYKSIADIHRAYPHLSYATIHYIANYYENTPRKTSKKISKIMERFAVTQLNTDQMFEKIKTKK